MRSPIAGIVTLLLAIAACTTLPGGSATVPFPTEAVTAAPGIDSSPSTPPSPGSPSASTVASGSQASSPATAARHLLEAEAADVAMHVVREKRPTDPVETLVTGAGRVEPAIGRGQVRYDLAGLFAPPGETPSPSSPDVADVIWTPADLFVRLAGDGGWEARTREHGRQNGGLLGRLPDEVLGLVQLVSESDPSRTVRLEAADLDGTKAERWAVTVPIEAAAGAGVPADVPDSDALRRQYGVSDIDIETWLVDDELRRLRVAFRRESAPYGGPDLTTTTYDWRPSGAGTPIEIPDVTPLPPAGDIRSPRPVPTPLGRPLTSPTYV